MQFHEQNLVGGASIQSRIRVGPRANSRPESARDMCSCHPILNSIFAAFYRLEPIHELVESDESVVIH
jgi:hypothetical protein